MYENAFFTLKNILIHQRHAILHSHKSACSAIVIEHDLTWKLQNKWKVHKSNDQHLRKCISCFVHHEEWWYCLVIVATFLDECAYGCSWCDFKYVGNVLFVIELPLVVGYVLIDKQISHCASMLITSGFVYVVECVLVRVSACLIMVVADLPTGLEVYLCRPRYMSRI